MDRVLVVHLNAMRRYAGFADDEFDPRILQQHDSKDQVFERYNFKVAPNGTVFGAWSKSQINLRRIDPNCPPNAQKLPDVLVIFWATFEAGHRKVVGWYKNATVWANAQENLERDRDQNIYVCEARESVLLGMAAAPPAVPLALKEPGVNGVGNHFGHWYAHAANGESKVAPWLNRLVAYIYSQPSIVAHTRPDLIAEDQLTEDAEIEFEQEQGYATNAFLRKSIEEYAVNRAILLFESKGYELVKKVGKPYDLLFAKGGKEVFVEVKGTQTNGSRIFLTPNEVACANEKYPDYHLLIVHSIIVSGEPKAVPRAGTELPLYSFRPDQTRLRPLAYSYLV